MKRHVFGIATAQRRVRCATIIFLFLVSACHAFADGGVRTVALSGQPAPGTANGIVFSKFGYGSRYFVFNNRGQVAFYGVLSGPGTTSSNMNGTWTEGRGSGLALLARGGDPSPGFPPGTLNGGTLLINLQFNNAGATAIGEHTTAFWTDNGTNTLQLIAQRRTAVPGIANATFDTLPERSVLNDLNRVTIPGVIDSNLGLFVYNPADGYHILFQTVAGQAPGLPDGVLIDPSPTTGLISGAETNSGRYFVVANLIGGGNAFWVSNSAGAPQFVLRSGDPAPGIPGAVRLGGLNSNPRLNTLGQYAFYSTLLGDGINPSNNAGIWTGDLTTGPHLAARLGDHAPGTPDGVVFAGNFLTPSRLFNERAQLALAANLSGTGVTASNDSGVWLGGGATTLALVAREGDPAPGAGAGVLFGDLKFFADYETIALNNFGQVAFLGALTGPGVTTATDQAIWGQDRNGVLRMILREGDKIDVDDGPGINLKTVSSIALFTDAGTLDHYIRINDAGQIAFPAIFTDGSQGLFVSNAIAVPEPCTWLLVASAAAIVTLRRQRYHQPHSNKRHAAESRQDSRIGQTARSI